MTPALRPSDAWLGLSSVDTTCSREMNHVNPNHGAMQVPMAQPPSRRLMTLSSISKQNMMFKTSGHGAESNSQRIMSMSSSMSKHDLALGEIGVSPHDAAAGDAMPAGHWHILRSRALSVPQAVCARSRRCRWLLVWPSGADEQGGGGLECPAGILSKFGCVCARGEHEALFRPVSRWTYDGRLGAAPTHAAALTGSRESDPGLRATFALT